MSERDRAEQALRVLDALEAHVQQNGWQCPAMGPASGGGFAVMQGGNHHRGRTLLDALAQWAQALVVAEEPWGEPGALDAESDLEAFDRATGFERFADSAIKCNEACAPLTAALLKDAP
jgi:hypothetical protein